MGGAQVRIVMLVVCLVMALLGPGDRSAAAQDTGLMLKIDLIVPAGIAPDRDGANLCVYLPTEASTVTVSRTPFVAETGTGRPIYMSIRPYVSTASPILERMSITADMSLTLPELGAETCFSFENQVGAFEAQGVAQSYKYFAQIVHVEVR